jgi:hypothetical protein
MMATVFRLNIVPAKRGAMREEFRKQLLSKLAEDIRQLESVIGRDLSAWME